ncbi:MAG: Bcr/CflA family drug resistance efflux transporter, partial [Flavobacterium sp.]
SVVICKGSLLVNNLLGLYETIAMLFLFLGCLGISNPNTAGLTMAPFAKNAGSASALMGAIQLGLGALASFAVGIFVKDSVAPMVFIMTATTIIAFIVLNVGKRFITQKVEVASGDDTVIGH